MNINEELEREYIFQYNGNKNILSKEQKLTIYNILELEKEQKSNDVTNAENIEVGFMSVVTSVIVIIIYIMTLFNDIKDTFGIPNLLVGAYFLLTTFLLLFYLIYRRI